MMVTPNPEDSLSPLDQIRQAEAEVTRRLAAAREAGELEVTRSRVRAKALRDEAREAGRREGQAQYRDMIANAEDEARAMIAEAQKRAVDLRQRGDRFMHTAVRRAVNVVIGQKWEEERVEP